MLKFQSTKTRYLSTVSSVPAITAGTVSFWFTPAGITGTKYIMHRATALRIRQIDATLSVRLRLLSSDVVAVVTLVAGTRYHFVGTWNGSGVQIIYINGAQDTSTSGIHAALLSGTLHIGSSTTPDAYWDGTLEDFRIYERVLSLDEVQTVYNSDGCDSIINGLIYHWRMNEKGPLPAAAIPTGTGTNVYYSVGTNTGDLKVASTVTIASGIATFSAAQADNIGVGDVISYGAGPTYAYISGRISNTKYTVVDNVGATPGDVSGQTVNSIMRAYNSLSAAEAGASDSTHLNTTDLTGSPGYILNLPCYADGDDTAGAVTIDGWTTGADNYINIYTPYLPNEVGVSQRHNGLFTLSGYVISATPGSGSGVIVINEDYVRITGIQVRVNGTNNDERGIYIDAYYVATASDIRIAKNIILSARSSGTGGYGISCFGSSSSSNSPVIKIWNNVVYGFSFTSDSGIIIGFNSTPVAYAYNNTVYNCTNGIYADQGGTIYSKNNLSYGSGDRYVLASGPPAGAWGSGSTNNLAGSTSDATIPATNARNGVTVTFGSTTLFDYSLAFADTGAKGYGADLSADSVLPFNDDINSQRRTSWDIGAFLANSRVLDYTGTIDLNPIGGTEYQEDLLKFSRRLIGG